MDPTDTATLRARLVDVLECYHPDRTACPHDGFQAAVHPETGDRYDDRHHLVASARFLANTSLGVQIDGPDWCAAAAEQAAAFLRSAHHDAASGGYDWLVDDETRDDRRVCYGHAFVLLGYARAVEAGFDFEAELRAVANLLVEQFFESEYDLCASEFDADFETGSAYRGQNANMHACEAFLAAHRATRDRDHLDRAIAIARALTVERATDDHSIDDLADVPLIWEHYDADWTPDFEYNRSDPRDQFRPWGYQPGHHLEWAKLLGQIDRRLEHVAPDHEAREWLCDRGIALFDAAVEMGWDETLGGLAYTVAPDGEPVVEDTYGWAIAEGIGAAATLFERRDDVRFRETYQGLWEFARTHLDAPQGDFYQAVTPTNEAVIDSDGPAVEPGYHPIGACLAGLAAFGEDPRGE
ncbi:AGE family epimerase/isomerase [Halococcoides cellulosivorans]|uniref:N-acylglucosamine 2-epimerase n=1 Tax=Halococcoides cellulosivorans TaxID=1679096 RepID=A0A2R4WZP7_9EURY|nr:AGE family epimerase/isomerase [Halococcoides cellulosivorans]AWB27022.1 N-acylglucosamine 2-epimerase [Halococcoides cellulosivorans]